MSNTTASEELLEESKRTFLYNSVTDSVWDRIPIFSFVYFITNDG
jgi:hypothetical protein